MSSGCIPKELQHHLRNSEPALVESLASSRCIGLNQLQSVGQEATPLPIFSHGAIRQASRKPAPSKPAGFAAAEIELPAAEEMAGAQDLLRLAKPQSDSDMDLAAAMGSKIEPSITITKAGLFNQCREMLDDLMATEPEIQLLSVLTKLQTGAGNEWAAPKDLESIEEIHSKGQESADSITERVQANFPSVNMQFMLNNHNQNGQSEADCRRHLSQSLMELGAIHATIRKGLEVKQQIHVDNPSAVNAMVSALLVTCHALAFNMLLSRLVSHFKPSHLAAVGGACGATAIATACLVPTAEAEQASPKGQTAATALDPNEWRAFKVQSIDTGGPPNTNRYRFSLPDPNQEVGLPVASCLVTRAAIGSEKEDGSRKFVIRPYTPTSPKDAKGYFDLVIKVYPQGNMSKHIGDLKEGDVLECKGPIEKFAYKPNMKKAIGMIAGGSGITPMLQVASEVLRNPQDKTEVSLIFANQTEQDIILREEIDAMADKHKNFKVHYTIDKVADGGPPEGWKGSVGYVTKEMAKANIPPPSDDNLILVCGPPPMYKALSGEKAKDKSQGELTGMLKDMGYTEKQVYKF
ncbi:hypothetical protein WJX84_007415 [Apatococcus fuscideae]|uniref:cytochrome-b5 reductase n=1 Tax=Apatococcus fuscideae TaxID=2026836 RepID=A0AAW1SC45_9CHLO